MRLNVKDIRDMFSEFDDDDVVTFDIDESTCEELKDSYRYEPTLGSIHREQDGSLICTISSEYSR